MNAARTYLSTDDVSARERGSFWRDLICDTFVQLDCTNVGDAFFGSIDDQPVGALQLTNVKSSQHDVLRTKRQIAKCSEDFFLISMQLSGQGVIEQDGRTAVLNPGDFAMYDSTRCYNLKFRGPFEELVLKAPRTMIRDRLAFPERMTATPIKGSSGMARVALEFVRSVSSQVHTLELHEIERLSHNVIDVVSAALGHSLLNEPISMTTTKSAQLIRIKMFITDNLRNPNLSRDAIATSNGISVRYLSKLFESENENVMHYVRDHRLDGIARDLADPEMDGRSISDLAYGWGINNISHFCRLFKARFGVTPRAYRVRAHASICAQ